MTFALNDRAEKEIIFHIEGFMSVTGCPLLKRRLFYFRTNADIFAFYIRRITAYVPICR